MVVLDTILPPPGKGLGSLMEARLRVRDLTMVQSFNSGEREMEDWARLIEGVRPRLEMARWEQPRGSAMAVLILRRDRNRDT